MYHTTFTSIIYKKKNCISLCLIWASKQPIYQQWNYKFKAKAKPNKKKLTKLRKQQNQIQKKKPRHKNTKNPKNKNLNLPSLISAWTRWRRVVVLPANIGPTITWISPDEEEREDFEWTHRVWIGKFEGTEIIEGFRGK